MIQFLISLTLFRYVSSSFCQNQNWNKNLKAEFNNGTIKVNGFTYYEHEKRLKVRVRKSHTVEIVQKSIYT